MVLAACVDLQEFVQHHGDLCPLRLALPVRHLGPVVSEGRRVDQPGGHHPRDWMGGLDVDVRCEGVGKGEFLGVEGRLDMFLPVMEDRSVRRMAGGRQDGVAVCERSFSAIVWMTWLYCGRYHDTVDPVCPNFGDGGREQIPQVDLEAVDQQLGNSFLQTTEKSILKARCQNAVLESSRVWEIVGLRAEWRMKAANNVDVMLCYQSSVSGIH